MEQPKKMARTSATSDKVLNPAAGAAVPSDTDSTDADQTPNADLAGIVTATSLYDGEDCETALAVEELRLMELSGAIREKKDWVRKLQDPEIRAKWRKELEEQNVSDAEWAYVVKELEQYYAPLYDPETDIGMSSVDGVFKSDALIDAELARRLTSQLIALEDMPKSELDWHPGSDEQVLDLVHPSLFCLIYGVTKVLKDKKAYNWRETIGGGQVFQGETESKKRYRYFWTSKKYQWLPSDIHVGLDGNVRFESYINNLHPSHQTLYSSLGKVLSCFIPMFEKCITEMLHSRRRIPDLCDWYEGNEQFREQKDGEDTDEYYEKQEEWEENRTAKPKDPPPLDEVPEAPPKTISLKGRSLQVIVKVASIFLTKDKPKFNGGVWHVEGMSNEAIVATGIYYYDNKNITESLLAFRTAAGEPEDYEQCDYDGVADIYGIGNEDAANQSRGAIECAEGRCIVFPNLYQHCVQPFELKDKEKPGHRRFLVFFLCDPAQRVISTGRVPPQQKSWFQTEVSQIEPFNQLPKLCMDLIMSFIDFPMDMSTAKHHREELMQERKYVVGKQNEEVFERPFSLCEH